MFNIRRVVVVAAICAGAVIGPAGMAFATGQPGTSAGFNCTFAGATVEPGNAMNAPGSAFNETLPGHAGTVYAGQPNSGSSNANSGNAVSQYDAACRALTNGGIGAH